MNDWIHHYFAAFWVACLVVGMAAGVWYLADAWGFAASLAAGAVGGAGSALILSISRYIAQNDQEDDGPPRPAP